MGMVYTRTEDSH